MITKTSRAKLSVRTIIIDLLEQPLLYDSAPYKIKKDVENKVGADPQKREQEKREMELKDNQFEVFQGFDQMGDEEEEEKFGYNRIEEEYKYSDEDQDSPGRFQIADLFKDIHQIQRRGTMKVTLANKYKGS